jgi:hypothetical protein
MIWLLSCAEPMASPPPPPPVAAPLPEPPAPAPPAPTFTGTAEPLPADMRAAMTGVTWREGCPVGLDDLALLRLSHWDFDGGVAQGELIVAAGHAQALLGVFEALFEAGFPIRRMRPMYHYGGSDDASMADDNTSAFNCRPVTGGSGGFSQHSYGHAVDINTVENPYVRGKKVLPPAGAEFLDRLDVRPGMIVADGPVVAAFAAAGWRWGGSWSSLKDYQHFSANGR